MKGSIKEIRELVIPSLLVTTNKGTTRMGKGIMVEESSTANSFPRPLKRNFANA